MTLQLRISFRYFFLALSLCVAHAFAQTTTENGMTFAVRADGTANLRRADNSVAAALTVPGTVNIGGTNYTVSTVQKDAFKDNTTITSVTFSEGLVTLEEAAFSGCTNLTTINLPASFQNWNHSLSNCTKFATFTVAAGSTYFAAHNGALCSADLKKVVCVPRTKTSFSFPTGVTEIGDYAFEGSLLNQRTFRMPATITTIGKYAFTSTAGFRAVTLPEALSSLGEGAFFNSTGINSISIPAANKNFVVENGVIYDYAKTTFLFTYGRNTATINVPSTVTTIAPRAAHSTWIRSVVFPEGLTTIGESAFNNCGYLSVVHFPSTLVNVGENAFSLAQIKTYSVAEGNPKYSALNGALYNADQTKLLSYPPADDTESPVLPNTLTSIAPTAFYGSKVKGTLVIPAGVTEIGDGAFGNASNVECIVIPEGITELKANLFAMSVSLKTVVLPATLTSISTNVFTGCNSLTDIECRAKQQPETQSKVTTAIKLTIRDDAQYEANVWGPTVTLDKVLAVVPLNMTSYKFATFHWNKQYVMPFGLNGATLRLNGAKLASSYDFLSGNVVNPETALLVYGAAGVYDMVETKFSPANTTDVSGNLLFGRNTEERYTAATNSYVYVLTTKNGVLGFYWQKGSDGTFANIKVNRGYVEIPNGSGVQGFSLEDNGFLTAIQGVDAETPAGQFHTPIFDLSGRSVQSPTRGLYIVNGKKVLR